MTILVGGVAELFQGDLDLGRHAVERLLQDPVDRHRSGPDVVVEELHYGAVAVAQRIQDLGPRTLILLAGVQRDRPAGSVHRHRVAAPTSSAAELQGAVADAVTGYVGLELVVEVASALGVLPARTVAIEVEPESVAPGDGLSDSAVRGLETMLTLARREVALAAALGLAQDLEARCQQVGVEDSDAGRSLSSLLDELDHADRHGCWDAFGPRRDALRLALAEGRTGSGMSHRDRDRLGGLLCELDRLQRFGTP